jgi:putative protein-disulfide isomerase
MTATLRYIYDPLCGWCYGAEPLVVAASHVEGLDVELDAGCLWPEPTSLPEATRHYIREADARVAAMSGQPYGEAYLDGLLFDPALVLHSPPTIAAVLAAASLDASKGLTMLKAIQHAHYEQGRHVVQDSVLLDIASECGFEPAAFTAALGQVPVDAHIRATRELMAEVGAQGFPTFVLDIDERRLSVPHHHFASDPAAFGAWLEQQIEATAGAEA